MRRSLRAKALLAICLGLAACHKPAAKPAPRDAATTVTVAPVREAPLAAGISANGLLIPKLEAAVSTELNGYRVAQVLVDQDAMVRSGQPLARLDDTLLRAQIAQQKAVVAQQQVAAERQQAESQRVVGLDNLGVLPQEQIVERRLAARSGVAAVQAAKAQLDDLTTRESMMTVRAPVGGLVLDRTARPGDVASPTMAMFRIAADDVIELNAEVPEPSLSGIHPGDTAKVELSDGENLTGRVRVVSPEVDQQTKLGHVRITLPPSRNLRSGGYGRALFTGGRRLARVAPDSAVRYDADGASVLSLTDDNHVKRVAVTTGARSGGLVELLTGPPLGTRVLLGGGAFVLDGDLVRPVEAPQS